MTARPAPVKVVQVADLGEWTVGYSEEHRSVALILRTLDGEEFGAIMPPDDAMAMGDQLVGLGTRFAPVGKSPAG